MKDKHDERHFQQYAKMNADGTIAAIVEVAVGSPIPSDHEGALYLDVTEYLPSDRSGLRLTPEIIAEIKAKRAESD